MAALALSPFTSTVFLKSKGSYHKEKKMQLQCRFLANEGRMQAKNGHFQPHALESKDKTVESIQRGQDLGALKRDIIRSVANTNRGKNATANKKQHILGLIEELEVCNPTTSPIDSPLLSGFWSLLYTAPTDAEKVDKYAGTEEGPFLARLKPLSFGTVRQTASFQVIDVQGGSVQNIADFVFFGIKGRLVIKGRAVKSSTPGKEYRRIDVTFESFFCRIGNWQSPEIPLDWVNPKGWVDTTFLDQDLRVGRGDKGSVFVSARVKE